MAAAAAVVGGCSRRRDDSGVGWGGVGWGFSRRAMTALSRGGFDGCRLSRALMR